MKHLGLFEGIGGFALAARWMGWKTVAWVEWNKYCQQILRKNFSEAKGYGAIEDFDGFDYQDEIDILTGGEPCQPNSTAGSRKGKDDHRFLWPEYFRVVKVVRPKVIINENVRGSVSNRVLDQKISDLESIGYTTWPPLLIPSGAIGAQHRRDRIWLAAHSPSLRPQKLSNELGEYSEKKEGKKTKATDWPATLDRLFISSGQAERIFSNEPPLVRGDNGIPKELDAIAALGNSADPRIIFEIYKAIEASILT